MLTAFLVLALTLFVLVAAAGAIRTLVLPALRTGTLQARGRVYSRASEPVRYWFGIVFWICLLALSLLGVVIATAEVFRSVRGAM